MPSFQTLVALVVIAACSRQEAAPKAAPMTETAAGASARPLPTAPDPTRLAPLAGATPLIDLEVPGFRPAVVSLPTGATTPRPVAVALHGNYDRPEWQCEVWRRVIGERGFILCPRGIPRRDVPPKADRWEYASIERTRSELEAGLRALQDRFTDHVAPGPILTIGFSLGAIHLTPIAQAEPERFSRLVLVEGGEGPWTSASARRFVEGGGERLFVACGQSACLERARGLGARLERAGLPCRSGGSARAGHTYDGPVLEAVRSEWPWLTEGDPRWNASASPP